MSTRTLLFLPLLVAVGMFAHAETPDAPLRVQGAVPVAVPVVEAIKILKNEQHIEVELNVNGGSYGGIAALGNGACDIALSTKPVSAAERAEHPSVSFNEIRIGAQAIVLTVSRDVWLSGIHSITLKDAKGIYEGTIQNWKELGGADQKINIFMNPPGRGIWEMLVQWLYGAVKKAPEKTYSPVTTAEEVRNSVEFTPGSFSQTVPSTIDNQYLFALGIKDAAGNVIEPTLANFANRTYPLCRDLFLVVDDRPVLKIKDMVDFMLSDRGQALIKKAGLIPLADLEAKH